MWGSVLVTGGERDVGVCNGVCSGHWWVGRGVGVCNGHWWVGRGVGSVVVTGGEKCGGL